MDIVAKILLSIDFTSPNSDFIFVILIFRFEILKILEILFDRTDNVINVELGRSDRDEQRMLARISVNFSKN